ncbi:hypothetical protein [Candidatus Scalindua japonica]|uniref:hypothetical protein n=1 Tax=Candidatus Scalindua japonica TaxID=1284222 RepID=UPI0013A53D56|nr:hypothetical protein [Candidatus Scalindua japonica]
MSFLPARPGNPDGRVPVRAGILLAGIQDELTFRYPIKAFGYLKQYAQKLIRPTELF